jgi:hypothetical protein
MGDIQREKSKDPIISEPTYIHATNGMSVRIPATLHVWSDQPALCLHSGTCGDDISVSGPADRSASGAEGTERTEWNRSSPDSHLYYVLSTGL